MNGLVGRIVSYFSRRVILLFYTIRYAVCSTMPTLAYNFAIWTFENSCLSGKYSASYFYKVSTLVFEYSKRVMYGVCFKLYVVPNTLFLVDYTSETFINLIYCEKKLHGKRVYRERPFPNTGCVSFKCIICNIFFLYLMLHTTF